MHINQSQVVCVCVSACVGEYKIHPQILYMQKERRLHEGHNRTFYFYGFYGIPEWTADVDWDRTEANDDPWRSFGGRSLRIQLSAMLDPTHGVKGFPLGIPNHKHMLIPSY